MNITSLSAQLAVGFLAAYSILEIVAYLWPTLRRLTWFFSVNALLLFVGVFGSFVTFVETGDSIALGTILLYLILAAAYLVRVFDRKGWGNHMVGMVNPFMRIWSFKKYVAHLILDTWLLPFIALLALVGIYLTKLVE